MNLDPPGFINGEKTIGVSVLIWLIRFGFFSLLYGVGLYNLGVVKLLAAVFSGAVAYAFCTKKIVPVFRTHGIWLGCMWAVIGIVLDASVTRHFFPDILRSWGFWIGYFFIILAPVISYELGLWEKKKADPKYHRKFF